MSTSTASPPTDRRTRARPRRFVLWREILVAYLSPALMAGAGGLITGQSDLLLAAFTSIAGTSAVVAALIGAWLRSRGVRRAWTTTAPRPVLVVWFVVLTATIAGAAAWGALEFLPDHLALPARIQWDLPLSGAVAATVIPWRWRTAQRAAERGSRPPTAPTPDA